MYLSDRILFLFLFFLVLWGGPVEADTTKPNIVYITVDDLNKRAQELGIMPELDRLASMGTEFTNAYTVNTQCQPQRLNAHFGVHPAVSKMRSNEEANAVFTKSRRGDYRNWPKYNFQNKQTWMQRLREDHGYYTATADKVMHIYYQSLYGRDQNPDPRSFDITIPWEAGLKTRRGEKVIGSTKFVIGKKKYGYAKEKPQLHMFEKADTVAAWLEDRYASGDPQPFAIGYGPFQPHEHQYISSTYGLAGVPESLPLPVGYQLGTVYPGANNKVRLVENDPLGWLTARRYYYASAHDANEAIRRVTAQIDWSNTILILTSDHGYCLGDYGNWGAKRMVNRCAAAVPYIFVGMGIPVQSVDKLVSTSSLYKTVMGLVGDTNLPDHIWGENLAPAITTGDTTLYEDRALTVQGKRNGLRWKSAQGDRWLYAANWRGNEEPQLFNLTEDPYELNDVLGDNPTIAAEGMALLAELTPDVDLPEEE